MRKFLINGALVVLLCLQTSPSQDIRTGQDKPIRHQKPDAPATDPSGGHELRNGLIYGTAGAVAGYIFGRAMRGGKQDPEKTLSEHGPQFPEMFSMSTISLLGFVRGNWPLVLEYELKQPGVYLLTALADGAEPFFYLLDQRRAGRQQQILQLPARFGSQPRPGTFTIRALTEGPGEVTPAYFRLLGIGCGQRAVGSVGIDQLRFTPPAIRPRDKEVAAYGFHSHADFEKVTAEFERVGLVDGSIVAQLEDKQDIKDVVRRDTEISNKHWDPRKAKAKPGQHLLQVRAWYTLKNGGDWVIAWSPQLVRIEE